MTATTVAMNTTIDLAHDVHEMTIHVGEVTVRLVRRGEESWSVEKLETGATHVTVPDAEVQPRRGPGRPPTKPRKVPARRMLTLAEAAGFRLAQ
jgi:hypothetical protein